MLTERENWIRSVKRTGPEWIPSAIGVSDASFYELKSDLDDVVARYPALFPGCKPGGHDWSTWEPRQKSGTTQVDPWGVLWQFDYDGLDGGAVGHPLDDWAKFEGFCAPDPYRYSDRIERDLRKTIEKVQETKKRGEPAIEGLDHGYFLMRLWYLRGFENLMLDIATDEAKLHQLIDMVVERNNVIVGEYIKGGVDAVCFGEDIGTQTASIISPRDFRKWIVPAYKRMMEPVKQAGIIVDTHSDGYIMELVDDLLDCGCDVLNPQDLCNGIDEIARAMKGRCCIRLDIDRQKIVPFGTRKEIHDLIEEEVRKLGSPEGGLQFICGIYPPTPPENIDAVCEALEKFRAYWSA